jgi:dihydroflavonol-4-reductase
MKVALTGAAGHLGAAILQELSARKIPVKALIRNSDTRACVDLPVEIISGDMLQAGVLNNLMQDCDTVIHSAALISVNGDAKGLVHKTNVEGTQLAVDAALQAGIKRFIHISSIHAYQQKPSLEILDEDREPITDLHTTVLNRQERKLRWQPITWEWKLLLFIQHPSLAPTILNLR